MARLSFLAKVNARLPVTMDDLWAVIRKLDEAGSWTAGDVCDQTNINPGLPRDMIRRLAAAGYLKLVGHRTTKGRNPQRAPLYRLVKRPVEWPRLQRDGTAVPEPIIETLWRTMKMTKVFTIAELAGLAERDGGEVNRATVRSYCDRLAAAGILTRLTGPGRETQFRLIRNVGRRAPKVLSTRIIYDPNSRTVVGDAVSREVSP